MDPISHLAFGRTLIALADRRSGSRGIVAAAVLAALMPDVDAIVMPFGWDRYLRAHEVGTHSLPGILVSGVLAAAVVSLWIRGARWRPLIAAGGMGAASHVLLDVMSGARVRVGWPIVDTHVSLPLVAMADPILLGLLVAGAVAVLMARRRGRSTAMVSLAIVAGFLAIKGLLGLDALTRYSAAAEAAGSPVQSRIVEARWGTLREWNVFDSTADTLRAWRASAGEPRATLVMSWPRAAGAMAASSVSLDTVRNFLRVHDLPLVARMPVDEGHSQVLWSDIRYCWDPTATGAPDGQPIVTDGNEGQTLACGLWFGAELDGLGRPRALVVRIGEITQTRAPGR